MRIDITVLCDGPNRLELSGDAESLNITEDEARLAGPVKVVLDLVVAGNDIRIDGTVNTIVEEECSRCLAVYRRKMEAELHLYAVGADSRLRGPKPDEDRGEGLLVHDGRRLDLSEEVRSAILLSTPMQPLCSLDCKGLCPNCGANLNEGQCACEGHRTDPRWKGLEKLRGQ
jgi:uncharacterized protein